MHYFYIPVGRRHLSTRLVSQWHCQCVESLTLTRISSRLEPGSFFRWLWQEYSGPPEPEKKWRIFIFEIFFQFFLFFSNFFIPPFVGSDDAISAGRLCLDHYDPVAWDHSRCLKWKRRIKITCYGAIYIDVENSESR